ncbi:hypothetical protein PFMALIP_03512, partial [Plasmodium falciparum MaliPS096_E11]
MGRRYSYNDNIEELKKLKKILLNLDVLIDVSKIVIQKNENFDMELLNNVNDRFVEKIYYLLKDKKKNMLPEEELVEFIFLLLKERNEYNNLEKKKKNIYINVQKNLTNCPIKNEVTTLIQKINKFYYYFKEFLLKEKYNTKDDANKKYHHNKEDTNNYNNIPENYKNQSKHNHDYLNYHKDNIINIDINDLGYNNNDNNKESVFYNKEIIKNNKQRNHFQGKEKKNTKDDVATTIHNILS